MTDDRDCRTERALAAYQVAHENAHHADTIMWEAAAIIWSANALLMGFVIEAVSSPKLRVHVLIAVISVLGIGMTVFLLKSFRRLKENQRISWEICHRIERQLDMEFKVHSEIHENYGKDDKVRMRTLYKILSILFILSWLVFFLISAEQIAARMYE
jgi:hypothetical protein